VNVHRLARVLLRPRKHLQVARDLTYATGSLTRVAQRVAQLVARDLASLT
jgi:hypothetical protein